MRTYLNSQTLTAWLQDNTLSQAGFARRLGCDKGQLSKIISGKQAVGVRWQRRILAETLLPRKVLFKEGGDV